MEIYYRVEPAGIGYVLHTLAVDKIEVHALDKVIYILVWAVTVALVYNRTHGGFSHALHGRKAETYVTRLVRRECLLRLVHVGPHDLYAHVFTLCHISRESLYIGKVAAQQRCHIFRRVVGLEVCRLVCHPRVARCVRFIEGIRGELLPVGPYLLQNLRVVAVLAAALDELGLQVIQFVLELLTHGLAQRVRLAAGEASQKARQQHDLLLIYRDAVGILQVFLHQVYVVDNGFTAVLAVDEVGNVIHRPRTVEGVHGDQILEGRGFQLAQVFLHAGRLELERTDSASVTV